MLTDLDRIVVATRDRRPVVQALRTLLDAEIVRDDLLSFWAAERTTLQTGVSEIEVLEPKAIGAVADFIGRRGPGLFAVGFASMDLDESRAHLETQGKFFDEHEDQLFLTADKGVDLPGLNLVVTAAKQRETVGLLQRLCSATLLHRAVEPESALLRVLGVRSSQLARVRQAIPGFSGTVIRLGESPASHLAILAPWGKSTPIGRFFFRHGSGIYQASAISEKLAVIRERLASLGPAPVRSADGHLLIPAHLLGGARLAVFPRAAGCSHWEVSSPMFDAQQAWV